MIELNLTESEFKRLRSIFQDYISDLQDISVPCSEELVGIKKSFETAGKPVLATTENKPRLPEG